MKNASPTRVVDRRSVLRGAAATAVAGLGAAAVARPASAQTSLDPVDSTVPLPPTRVRSTLKLVDGDVEQRFLLTDRKPPIIVQGKTYPAEMRQGPDHGSYLIFNDEDQNEKGGIIASTTTAQLALDYPNAQGATLNTVWNTQGGVAKLLLTEMPDPTIPVDKVTTTDRVLLGCSNLGDGALLLMMDSKENPRILLTVDGGDVPRLLFLDADGNVSAQFPPEDPAAASAKPAKVDVKGLLRRLRGR